MQSGDPKLLLCPYCGERQPPALECRSCHGCLDEWSIRATQTDMGPWFVRDSSRPHFVGFSLEALVASIRAGEIGMNAIVRGPTTRQLWTIARRTPGLAHLFGRCYACQAPVTEDAPRCTHCGAEPHAPGDRDAARNFMGLPAIERVAPPADARPDLGGFIEDSSMLFVRIAPVVPPVDIAAAANAAGRARPMPPGAQPFVPAAVSVTVRHEPSVPDEPPVRDEPMPRSALTPSHVGLVQRARSLERTNRLLFGLALISFVVAVGLLIFIVGQAERQRLATDARVAEAIRGVRAEFERKTPVVIPPPAALPPMPDSPPAATPRQR